MGRHTIQIESHSNIHSAELSFSLSSICDGDCVKLVQNNHQIYLIYRFSEKIDQKNAIIGRQIMILNHIQQGQCTVQQFQCPKVQHLIVRVSSLSWKIINVNQSNISHSILEQVSIVWPGSLIPIYYDQLNYVVLKPQCSQVVRLDINTTIEFVQECQENLKNISQSQIEKEHQKTLILSKIINVEEGYLNIIKVPDTIIKSLSPQQTQILWIIQNQKQKGMYLTINEFLESKKKSSTQHQQTLSTTNRKLVILKTDQLDFIQNTSFHCSSICKQIINLSQKICITNQISFKPNLSIISFDLFMKNQNLIIKIQEIMCQEIIHSPLQFQQLKKQTIQILAEHITTSFIQNKPFLILQGLYPFRLKTKLYTISIQNTKQTLPINTFYQLKYIGSNSKSKSQQIQSQLILKKIVYYSSHDTILSKRYDQLKKWRQINYTHQLQLSQPMRDSQSVLKLFESIYLEQIMKIESFLEKKARSRQICLITSFGNNGKTLFHSLLRNRGKIMWKISFRQLANPQLSFNNIEIYLVWLFTHSPFPILYLDDLDVLCQKIEESDQQKKKEHIVSKLLVRLILRLSKLYKKSLIITCKSESTLDDDLMPQLVVQLKNPSLQHRQQSLRSIHAVVNSDDSPIHQINKDISGQRIIKQSQIDKIAECTESLTFGSFCKYALKLQIPQTKAVSQQFNFSKLAGLSQIKKTITSIIEKPIKYAFLFRSVPIKLPRGILLYGATGNGKTAIGNSLKDQFKMKYFSVKGSDILSKYIGGSEAAVRDIFQKALSVSPSIIFFDQFQSIVPKRSSNNTGVNDRIVNQFLCYLDGVSSISGVYIVAASSRPDLIDPAVLRPGRLDAHLFLDYPKSEQRKQLINMFSNSVKISIDEEQLVNSTQNFSYCDMIGLFKQLRIKKSAQILKKNQFDNNQFRIISKELFSQTLSNYKLSVSPIEQQRQKKLYLNFAQGSPPDIQQQRQIQQ